MTITQHLSQTAEGDPLLILGETVFRHRHQRFGLLPEDRLRHLWLLGKTGCGKSTLLANLAIQDLEAGNGFALLDPHGDLVDDVLPFVPPNRINNVLLFAPEDRDYPVSFNVFRRGRSLHPDTALLASGLLSVFKKHWADSWGPRLEHILRNAILAVANDQRATLLFLYRFLTDEALRDNVVATVSDPVVAAFWKKEFPGYTKALQAEAIAPVLNKLGAFVANPIIRAIVGQERSRVDFISIMETRGIIFAKLPSGRIGEDASRLLGSLLLTAIQLAAMERSHREPTFTIYADEFQHFVTDSLATMLAEARKFGLGLVLAHQYLGQLPVTVRDALLGNVGSVVCFRLGAHDAEILAPEFNPPFVEHDLQHLGRYHAAVKILARGESLRPFTMRTLEMKTPTLGAEKRVARLETQVRRRFCDLITLNVPK
ncbi:MAG: type IV secretion system DNA-binding domain-containing protein [Patescibacteria group bacterium]